MSIQHYTWSHAGMVRAEPSNGGTFIASEDHAAEVEKLLAVVKFAARFSCDVSLQGTFPTCSEQYPDQRDTHWCVGCMARDALSKVQQDLMEPKP